MLIKLNRISLSCSFWDQRWLEYNLAVRLILHIELDGLFNFMEAESRVYLCLQIILVHLLNFRVHLFYERLRSSCKERHKKERFKRLILSEEVDGLDVSGWLVRQQAIKNEC